MKMRKTLALAMAGAMVLSLAACGSSSTSSSTSSTASTSSTSSTSSTASTSSTSSTASFSYTGAAVKLTVTSHDPQASATGQFLEAWAKSIDNYTGSKITFTLNHGGAICGPKDTYDYVENDSQDIGFGMCSYYGGTLDGSNVISLPGLGIKSAAQGSYAEWYVYKQGLLDNEYSNFHVLLLWANCKSPISTKDKQISTIADFQGMSIRANAGPPTTLVQDLGASTFSCPISELYTDLDNGAVGACITDWHGIDNFQLYEVCKYYLDEDFGCSAYFLLMNKDKYDSLDPALQQALDSLSGDTAIKTVGDYWDKAEATARADATKNGGTIYTLPTDEETKLKTTFEQVTKEWIAATTNGQALYDAVVKGLAAYK